MQEPITLHASDFETREELEAYIRNEIGDDAVSNRVARHVIDGTEEELKRLSLSTSTSVFGLKCKIIIKDE